MKCSKRVYKAYSGVGRGFSLIELLVVIALVSALVAILLPALRLARLWSKRVNCQANLRQITQAWHMYFNDNDGRFYQGINADVEFVGWRGLANPDHPRPLNKYLSLSETPETEGQAAVARCPADTGDDWTAGLSVYTINGTSYRTNVLMIGPTQIPALPDPGLTEGVNRRLPSLRMQDTAGHSRLLLVGDCGWVNQWWPGSGDEDGWHGRPRSFNLAFMDGHTAFVPIRKGVYVANEYTVIPFQELYGLARDAQRQGPSE